MTDKQRADLLLDEICAGCQKILGDNVIGVYVHGSLAFGCFSWATGDIDFLLVVQRDLTQREKESLIRLMLETEKRAPAKGIEMSVMHLKDCRHFVHPSPYLLHYSQTHRASYESNIAETCQHLQGTDYDLAAHCTVTKAVGYPAYGAEIERVFGAVPRWAYIDSLLRDVEDATRDVLENPIYMVLNLCRVLAYLREGKVLSKADGGVWGITHVSEEYTDMLQSALDAYAAQGKFKHPKARIASFAAYMLGCINDAK